MSTSLPAKLIVNAAAALSVLVLVAFVAGALADRRSMAPSDPMQIQLAASNGNNGNGGNGNGQGSTRTITINQTPGTVEGLYPGNPPISLDLTVGNPNNQDVAVSSLTGTVVSVDKPLCATTDVKITQLPSTAYPFTIKAGLSVHKTLSIQMVSSPGDACRDATFTINYFASGGAA